MGVSREGSDDFVARFRSLSRKFRATFSEIAPHAVKTAGIHLDIHLHIAQTTASHPYTHIAPPRKVF
jgi:hypothetical protein